MYWWATVYGRVDEHLLNCPMQWLDDQTICIAFCLAADTSRKIRALAMWAGRRREVEVVVFLIIDEL